MSIQEILEKGNYQKKTDSKVSVFTIHLKVPIFNNKVPIIAYNLSNLTIENEQLKHLKSIINEIVSFNISNLIWVKEEIWKHYNSHMQNTCYGYDDDPNYSKYSNEEGWNRAFFNIYSPSDAYENTKLTSIFFDLNQTKNKNFLLDFDCSWENEHGITMCIRNSKLHYIE